MASVQVRILQSGRTDAYGLPLVPGSVATVERSYAVGLVYSGFASWMNPADAYDGQTNFRKPDETYTLYQSGRPFWIPAGDGGANGLSFTGTRGVFSLSAESPLANSWSFLAVGGYVYIPAGAGGLVSGGWYWCVMNTSTSGEIFQETYPGSGTPALVTSPTSFPNLTAGRITQLTSELNAVSFTIPGNALGPNGVYVSKSRLVASSAASAKTLRLRISNASPDTRLWALGITNSFNVFGCQFTGFTSGNSRIIKCTGNSGTNATWDNPASQTSVTTGDVLSVDLTVDQTITMSGQLAANTDSLLFVPGQFTVQYGA